MQQDPVELLLETDLLGNVPEEILRNLSPAPEWVSITPGETLIKQGQKGQAYYLLIHGRLRVFVTDNDGKTKTIGEVSHGEGVGEMSLLTDDLTAATVRATHDSELVRFSRDSYKQLMKTSPEAALQITRTVINRLRSGLDGHQAKLAYTSIAIIPIDPDIDTTDFVNKLSEQLSHFTPTSIVSVDDMGTKFGDLMRGTEQASPKVSREIASKLSEFNARNSITLYIANYEATEWTRMCLRQADLVLRISTVDSDSSLTNAESSLIDNLDKELAPRNELVLLHPEEWRQHCGTDRWIKPRDVAEFHHLRAHRATDFARLARILTGNAINLVLGGGGARGFAQIGVLRALLEKGIPIDRVAGTSMGSLIGALFAQGQSIKAITAVNRRIWIEGKPLSDYTFPIISLVRGRRLHNLIKNTFLGCDVENLPITFFCVSSNLTKSELMLHDRGAIWEGIRASGSIPGAGPPLFLRGNVLVDGGVLNNLPSDLMRERHQGAIIGVDVSTQEPMTVPEEFDGVPSGWRMLLNKFNPFERNIQLPGIFRILYRSSTLGSAHVSTKAHAQTDFLLMPPVGEFNITAFNKMDEIIEIGYQYTLAQLHGELDPRIARYVNLAGTPLPDDLPLTASDPVMA